MIGCSFQPQEERFVNPLFYKTLYASNILEYKKITPISVTYISDKGDSSTLSCELIKDVGYQITMKCLDLFESQPHTSYYRFTNAGIGKYNKDACEIFTEIFTDPELTNLEMSLWHWTHLNKGSTCGLNASPKDFPPWAHY